MTLVLELHSCHKHYFHANKLINAFKIQHVYSNCLISLHNSHTHALHKGFKSHISVTDLDSSKQTTFHGHESDCPVTAN